MIVAEGYRSGHADVAKKCGWCAWRAAVCKDPVAVQMFVFPRANKADVLMVDRDRGVEGPMPKDEVNKRFPEFAKVMLEEGMYYVWPIIG